MTSSTEIYILKLRDFETLVAKIAIILYSAANIKIPAWGYRNFRRVSKRSSFGAVNNAPSPRTANPSS